MTTVPDPDNPDTENATVPPYEGRREAADVDDQDESEKDGAKTAGATGPVEDDEKKAPAPEGTERGATASPADEQPADNRSAGVDSGPGATGPDHITGTGRAEDKP
ncbi:hypothetical protein [Nocardioides sp.]|uniref:hypothetical protein n=1 Tax=Nocardioides sp. TaxID=35761 RepID=UPI002736D817|nr:hypothetical protein [Nocardioides sp.]MDP3891814.1 hypothetical protein [Nocardioides sp.]